MPRIDPEEAKRFDRIARRILGAAISEDRCGELLLSLFDGASATVDLEGKLVIAWLAESDERETEPTERSKQ